MTPALLDGLTEDLYMHYYTMESKLLDNIAKKIGKDKELFKTIDKTNIVDWQLQRLQDMKGLTDENKYIIANLSKKTPQEIDSIFKQALKDNPDTDLISKGIQKNLLKKYNDAYIIQKALLIASVETKSTFNKINNSVLQSSYKAYTKTINDVTTNVLAGLETAPQATVNAVKKMVNNGLTGFTMNNGSEWSPEAYASMVIKSNVKNTINKVQDERIKSSGGNYIEINQYAGARPLCSQDQGHIFSLNGDTTPIRDINGRVIYPRSWEDSTYGEPAGILGINCGHQKFLFVPELSAYNSKPIPQKENDAIYEEKQQQRYLEREIKNAKREKSALENVGADNLSIKKSQEKIRDRQEQLKGFLQDTGRTRRSSRETIVTGSKPKVSKPITPIKPKIDIPKAEIPKAVIPTSYPNSNLSINFANNVDKAIREDVSKKFDEVMFNYPFLKGKINNVKISNLRSNAAKSGSFSTAQVKYNRIDSNNYRVDFSECNMDIMIKKDVKGPKYYYDKTIYHETAHSIDLELTSQIMSIKNMRQGLLAQNGKRLSLQEVRNLSNQYDQYVKVLRDNQFSKTFMKEVISDYNIKIGKITAPMTERETLMWLNNNITNYSGTRLSEGFAEVLGCSRSDFITKTKKEDLKDFYDMFNERLDKEIEKRT